MKALLVVTLVIGGMLGPPPATADHAGTHASPGSDYWGVTVTTEEQGSATEGTVGSAAASTQASFTTFTLACGDKDSDLRTDHFDCDPSQLRCGPESTGLLYYVAIHHPDGSVDVEGPACYDPQDVGELEPRITPGMVLSAFERVPLPKSRVVVQPPGGQTLVGLDTIFSTEAERFTEVVQLLGRRVELDIRPSSYRWTTGDGRALVTDWPGRRWREGLPMTSYIRHVYEKQTRLLTRVDTTWSARYRVDGGPWRPVPGSVTMEGDSSPLRVRSATPHLVGTAG